MGWEESEAAAIAEQGPRIETTVAGGQAEAAAAEAGVEAAAEAAGPLPPLSMFLDGAMDEEISLAQANRGRLS